jgi:hypothetical protein
MFERSTIMQEDVLGTRRAASPAAIFVQCVRCGKATPRSEAKIVTADVLSESHSDFEYLCRDCQKAIEMGEQDLTPES